MAVEICRLKNYCRLFLLLVEKFYFSCTAETSREVIIHLLLFSLPKSHEIVTCTTKVSASTSLQWKT